MKALRFPQLRAEKGIPFSRVHVDRLEKLGRFPKRFNLGANSVAWVEAEIDQWLKERAENRDVQANAAAYDLNEAEAATPAMA